MSASTVEYESASTCPVALPLEPDERLYVPHRKRLYHSYSTNAEGGRELRIDYGVKEVTFDEVHLFPFAEQLIRVPSFTGAEATQWGPGYAWDELCPLLEILIDEGVIKRGGGEDTSDVRDPRFGGLVPSPLPPSTCPHARYWSTATCEPISEEIAGRGFEIGYLESVVPIYRIAHAALDADGRQVGEGNVFPPALRLDVDTEWRICQYAGSRYRDSLPMNVTGLKAMIKHWKPMMATIAPIRAAVRERLGPLPPEAEGAWTTAELHLLAISVLAFPTFQLVKAGGATPQRPLHQVLSSLFRITDGIRMTTYNMMFAIEHTRPTDERITAAKLYEHAELYAILIGETGVCAGPKPLFDEFLATAVDGAPPEGIAGVAVPAEVEALLADLPAVIDYAALGLQAWATSSHVWLDMSRAYQSLLQVFDAAVAAAPDHAGVARVRDRLRKDWHVLEKLQITFDYDREVHRKAYEAGYEPSWTAARTKIGPARLRDAIAIPDEGPDHRAAAARLRALFTARHHRGELAGAFDATTIQRAVAPLVALLRAEQAALAATTHIQREINALLARPAPTRPLTCRDLASLYAFSAPRGSFPYLFDSLAEELGIFVEATADDIVVRDQRAS